MGADPVGGCGDPEREEGGVMATMDDLLGQPSRWPYVDSSYGPVPAVPVGLSGPKGAGTPAPEDALIYPGQKFEITGSDTIRWDSTGTYTGRAPFYRGSRFLVPVGTGRLVVKARKNDVDVMPDDGTFVPVTVQVTYAPRGIAVPRA